MEWNFVYRLGIVDSKKHLPYILTNNDSSGDFKLKLTGMTFQHTASNELYLYGNALLIRYIICITFSMIFKLIIKLKIIWL